METGAMGPLTLLGQSDCTPQSIVKALDNFLRAVQQMKEVVMVPNRLKDMTVYPTKENGKNSQALMLLNNNNSLFPTDGKTSKIDLYSFYSMLYSIRNELVCGPSSSLAIFEPSTMNVDENQESDEQAARLAASFRQHMQGLFNILSQLTDTANYLSKKYQDEFDNKK